MAVVSIKFKEDGKPYYFDAEDFKLEKDDYVIVETEKGDQLGIVYDNNVDVDKMYLNKELRKVVKKATKKDYNIYLSNLKEAKEVVEDIRVRAEQEGLQMRVVDASFTFDKKHLIGNFLADERVDFRELVKYLAAKYKAHIELHQIGVRDKAKEIGGIGQCGMPLCCKTFKSNMDGISINMAKNQSISLSPSKINGCCGRLLCCLSYEDATYKELKASLPKVNEIIDYNGNKCKVTKIDILKSKVYIDHDGEEIEVDYNEK